MGLSASAEVLVIIAGSSSPWFYWKLGCKQLFLFLLCVFVRCGRIWMGFSEW